MPANNPQDAAEKWERKTDGNKWKQNVEGKRGDYESGVADFLGVSSQQVTTGTSWETEVNAVSASDYENATQGKGQDWASGYTEAMTE